MHKKEEDSTPASGKPYATDDVSFSVLGQAAIALMILTVISGAVGGAAYWGFISRENAQPAHMLETTPIAPDPNVPILQREPEKEIHKFRADEYDAEHSYAHWKDGDGKESLRIPIERAMEIVKAKGLPKPVKQEPIAPESSASPDTSGLSSRP